MQIQPKTLTYLQTLKCFDKGCIWNMRSTAQVHQVSTSVYSYSLVYRKLIDDLNLIKIPHVQHKK